MKRKYLLLILCVVLVTSVALAACGATKGFEYDKYQDSGSTGGSNERVLPEVPAGKASEPSVQIHYHRNNSADYKTWGFWLWTKSGSVGSEDKEPYGWRMNYQDDFGGVALYKFSELGLTGTSEDLGIIAKKLEKNWTKDGEADRWWALSAAEKDDNDYYHIYLTQGDNALYNDGADVQYGMSASFTSASQIAITTKNPVNYVKIYEGSELIAETKTKDTVSIRYNFPSGKQPDVSKDYKVVATFKAGNKEVSCAVGLTVLYSTDLFNNAFYYDGDLGAIYSEASTTFKVWSPVSTKITLNLYDKGNGTETPTTHEMTKGEKGVWSVTVNGDLEGKYYTYRVYNASYPTGAEIVDPYAKSAGLNGARGMIVDFSKTNPTGWDAVTPIAYDHNELVVWETHVADVTSSSTWGGNPDWSKKFKGMWQSGTTYQGETTGFDHIKDLGVNAVQLVPIFDQANDEVNVKFNWGYNPLNYNVLEGAYSTNASDGYARIREFKELVQAYNQAGINIIMDVVYNHVSSAVGSNFDVLMPGYYFRYDSKGDMANGSGCGNETASDHLMFRKFMIDSTSFWAKEYKLGGFRFDLMGLHDVDTMNKLVAELVKINPSIVVYGEPWEGGSTPLADNLQADQKNANKFEGFGQFNDQMRDALIKGGLNEASAKGWVTTSTNNTSKDDLQRIVSGLKGITDGISYQITNIIRTVNYVTCHDNYTLIDRIWASGFRAGRDDEIAVQAAMLANSVVLTSNGVTFMLAGEEFLRSKKANGAVGDEVHNSYEASYKVNELDYALKVTNKQIFENYQKLIALKTSFKELGLTYSTVNKDKYTVEVIGNGSAFEINIYAAGGVSYKIVHANKTVKDLTVNFEGYELYLDTLGTNVQLSAQTAISPYQTIIGIKQA